MGVPTYAADDMLREFQALLPRGRVWPRDGDAVQTQVIAALVPTWARLAQAGPALLVQAFPSTAQGLLPEWEATLGLPDPCAGPSPTLEQRQGQVVARLTDSGGQSVPFLEAYAADLGFTITVTEFSPFKVGVSTVETPIADGQWAFAWQSNAPLDTVTVFNVAQGTVADPLAAWGNAVLECELKRIAPAHTIPIFAYS